MKSSNIIYLIIIFSIATSCQRVIEEVPKGRIDEKFLTTPDGLKNLVISQYHGNRILVDQLRTLGCFPSDIFTFSLNGPDIIRLTQTQTSEMPSLSSIKSFWQQLYSGINNLNFGLNALKENTITGGKIMEGELSFLRAWHYLMIVETWGEGAHYTTEPTSSIITEGNQQKIDAYYSLILSDINNAIENLPENASEWGRLTKPAAKAMKARILLALAGYGDDVISKVGFSSKKMLYSEAIANADDVINNYSYKLIDDFEKIFDIHNERNNEIIWAIQFTNEHKYNTNGHGLHRYWVPNYNKSARTQAIIPRMYGHSIFYGREYRHQMMTKYFLLLYSQNDKRLDATIQTAWHALWDESKQEENAYGVPFKNGHPTDTVLFKPLYNVDAETAMKYEARGIAIDGLNDIYDENGVPKQSARGLYHTMKKYLDPTREVPKEEESHKDVIVLRLAEQYLIAAECAHFLGDNAMAANYINNLRERARKNPDDLAVNAADINIDFLLDERAREMGGELIRWFDLKRTHKLVERVKKYNPDAPNIQAFHELRPIPQSEMDKITNKDAFKQNPGYPQ